MGVLVLELQLRRAVSQPMGVRRAVASEALYAKGEAWHDTNYLQKHWFPHNMNRRRKSDAQCGLGGGRQVFTSSSVVCGGKGCPVDLLRPAGSFASRRIF
eukprot:6171629-Amphidinium_carterae.1